MKRFAGLRSLSAAVILVLAGATAGSAHGAVAATEVKDIAATASGSVIAASASVILGGEAPVEVGKDAVGDNLGGPATNPFGLDITALNISQPKASEPTLLFTLKLGQMVTGLPETVQYNWDIMVDGGADEGGSNWSIKSMRTRASSTQTAAPYAGLFTCVPGTAQYTCTQRAMLAGVAFENEEAAIQIPVPMSAIGAEPGSTITAWARSTNPVWIGPSAGGAQTLTNIFDTATHQEYVVPTPSIQFGLAPSGGTPATTVPGSKGAGDRYSATLTAPSAGTYDVVAKACFSTNCASQTIPVTVN
jgi:hypothetical protein